MSDNFHLGCPAKSGPGFRELGNFGPNVAMNEYIAAKNQLSRDDEYRLYLQQNAGHIIDNEWAFLREKQSCFPNECIFDNARTLVHPSIFNEEMKRWNSTRYVDSKKYFSVMNKKFDERIKNGKYEPMYTEKDVIVYREPMQCRKFRDYNAF